MVAADIHVQLAGKTDSVAQAGDHAQTLSASVLAEAQGEIGSGLSAKPNISGPAAAMLAGFEVTHDASQVVASQRELNADQVAAKAIHDAAAGVSHFFGLYYTADQGAMWNAINDKTPEQIRQIDQIYRQEYSPGVGNAHSTGIMDEFKKDLSSADYDRMVKLVNEKSTNDVPVDQRVSGESILTDKNLRVGEMNRLTTADGRKFDLYIPENARHPIPLVVAMHGVTLGDAPNLMQRESGMNIEAERKGVAVAYAYPEVHARDGIFGISQPVGNWNMVGKKNLEPTNNSYDDAKYLDNVISRVSGAVKVDSKHIGLMGMSDGGRFAEDYAGARPGKIASVVVEDGTWMQGETAPEAGTNVMIVHGLSDHTLPYSQGEGGDDSRGFLSELASSWIPGTEQSRPWQQKDVWRAADGATGPGTVTHEGNLTISDWRGAHGEVKEYLIDGAEHAINDYKNNGGMIFGEPDRTQDFSAIGTQFILDHTLGS